MRSLLSLVTRRLYQIVRIVGQTSVNALATLVFDPLVSLFFALFRSLRALNTSVWTKELYAF